MLPFLDLKIGCGLSSRVSNENTLTIPNYANRLYDMHQAGSASKRLKHHATKQLNSGTDLSSHVAILKDLNATITAVLGDDGQRTSDKKGTARSL